MFFWTKLAFPFSSFLHLHPGAIILALVSYFRLLFSSHSPSPSIRLLSSLSKTRARPKSRPRKRENEESGSPLGFSPPAQNERKLGSLLISRNAGSVESHSCTRGIKVWQWKCFNIQLNYFCSSSRHVALYCTYTWRKTLVAQLWFLRLLSRSTYLSYVAMASWLIPLPLPLLPSRSFPPPYRETLSSPQKEEDNNHKWYLVLYSRAVASLLLLSYRDTTQHRKSFAVVSTKDMRSGKGEQKRRRRMIPLERKKSVRGEEKVKNFTRGSDRNLSNSFIFLGKNNFG